MFSAARLRLPECTRQNAHAENGGCFRLNFTAAESGTSMKAISRTARHAPRSGDSLGYFCLKRGRRLRRPRPPCMARFSSPLPARSPGRNNRRRRRTPQGFQACRPRRSSAFGSFNSSPTATRLTILRSRTAPSSTSDTCNGTAMEPNSSIPPSIRTFVWAYGHRRDS